MTEENKTSAVTQNEKPENYMNFLEKYVLSIPPIQRDYVQGSDVNREKRDKFIDAILERLKEGIPLNLRFIYGSSYSDGKDGKPYFTPVDGQQRLTTLVLTIWLVTRYMEKKDPTLLYSLPIKEMNYSTRTSAKDFLNNLLATPYPSLEEGEKISDWVRKVPAWYVKSWEKDPSVEAMLDFLDKVDEKFKKFSDGDKQEIVKNLYDPEKELIIFDFLDMDEYKFNEDLYVKMNARGKHLTDFENWKAEFFGFLKSAYGESKANEFSALIEGDWTNLFWLYAVGDKDLDVESDEYPRIDEYFMRFYDFITEMLYLSDSDLKAKAKQWEVDITKVADIDPDNKFDVIYKNPKNLEFLFNALNAFYLLATKNNVKDKKNIANLFEDLLLPSFDPSEPYDPKVNIMGEVNLFENLINGKEVILAHRILLYLLIKRLIDFSVEPKDERLKYLRTSWGLLLRYNQRIARSLSVDYNLRAEDIREINQAVDEFNKIDVFAALKVTVSNLLADERKKAELESKGKYDAVCLFSNLPELRGVFRNFWNILENNTWEGACKKMIDFLNENDESKVMDLIECGFDGAHPHSGNYHFYGVKGHWDYVLSANYDSNKQNLPNILEEKIDGTASPQSYGADTFQYYFLKYEEFRNSSPNNYFYIESPFKVWALKRISASPRGGYNSCPYAFTVVKKSEKSTELKLEQWSYWSSHGSFWSKSLGFEMECVEKGWLFKIHDQVLWDAYPGASKFTQYVNQIIPDEEGKDRIETALDFLKKF